MEKYTDLELQQSSRQKRHTCHNLDLKGVILKSDCFSKLKRNLKKPKKAKCFSKYLKARKVLASKSEAQQA